MAVRDGTSWKIVKSSRVKLTDFRIESSSKSIVEIFNRVELLFFNFELSFELLFLGNFLMIFKSRAFNMQRYWVTWKNKENGYIFHFIGSEFQNFWECICIRVTCRVIEFWNKTLSRVGNFRVDEQVESNSSWSYLYWLIRVELPSRVVPPLMAVAQIIAQVVTRKRAHVASGNYGFPGKCITLAFANIE